MSDSQTGNVALNSDMYFTCSSGLAPAKIYPTQHNHATKDKFYYLVKDDTATQQIGDFCCRWTLVLAAAIAAAGVVTGGAALVVLAAVAVAASAALCGGLAAPFRKWVGYSTLNAYGRRDAYSLTSKCQMMCPIGGVINYAPGITSQWQALVYTARNTGWALLEGALIGKLGTSGLGAFAGTATPAMGTALLNFVALNATARGIGVADQVLFEGMLREGKAFSDTKEEAKAGATMFEQPFINIYDRLQSGYYQGGYAKDAAGNNIPEAHNGHGTGALYTDLYYAGLSAVSLGLMTKGAATHENITLESVAAAKKAVAKAVRAGKKFLFERGNALPEFNAANYTKLSTEKLGDFGERVAEDYYRSLGYDEFYAVQNRSGNGVDIVARKSGTGEMIKTEVKTSQQERLWNNGDTKEIPMSPDQRTMGGEQYTNDRLQRAANGEDGYTDGRSSQQAREALRLQEEAELSGKEVKTEKMDIYVDDNGNLRGNPVLRDW